MPNTNRPFDSRCSNSPDYACRTPFENEPAGVCTLCGLGSCDGCGAVMTPGECATSRTECPTPQRNEVYCPTCLREICEGPAEEETVETKTLSDAELLALREVG